MITLGGVLIDKDKVLIIVERPTPKSLTDVQSFHRLAIFYRCLIKNFSSQLASITNYLKQNQFELPKEAESCFLFFNNPYIVLVGFLKGLRSAFILHKH